MTVGRAVLRPVVVITGSSSGIGRATAAAMATADWNVVLVARATESLTDAAAECAAAGADTLVVTADVGDRAEVDAMFEAASAKFGRVTAVVHTAAVVGYGRFEDIPAKVFDRVITTNLLGTANVARSALRHFGRHGGGDLVLMGSLLGKIAVPYMSPYVTSKWGVHALARMLQIEAKRSPGVRISLISPGSVNTPAYSQAANYLGRQGRPPPPIDPPEKVARAVLRALRKPTRDRSVGIANPVVVLGFRALPGIFDLLVSPLMRLAGLSRIAVEPTTGSVLHAQPTGDARHGVWNRLGRRTDSAAPPSRQSP